MTDDSSPAHEDIELQALNSDSKKEPRECQTLHLPPDCCPRIISKHFSCCSQCIPKRIQELWKRLRTTTHCLVEHPVFEWIIIISILASSTALVSGKSLRVKIERDFSSQALEDIHTRKDPKFCQVLAVCDKIFTIIFTVELILKWLAYGIKNYFRTGWNILDFIIVLVSVLGMVLDLLGVADIPVFKSMRTLRALRPLKALSRFEGIRVGLKFISLFTFRVVFK